MATEPAAQARGEIDRALPHFAEAVRIEPKYFVAHYDYGAALLEKNDLEGARAEFEAAVKYQPDCGDAYYGIGQTLERRGKSVEAIVLVRKGLELGLTPENTRGAIALLAKVPTP